jgi:sphingosine kinase
MSDSSKRFVHWPVEAAANVLFQVPVEWKNNANDAVGEFCKLQYDAEERLVQIVDSINPLIVLDVLDVDDMIGAAIEVKMRNNDNNGSHNRDVSDSNNNDNTRASNEPSSDVLSDNQASATLSTYMYPREDLSKKNSWKFWSSNDKHQRQPYYRRICKSNPNEAGPHPKLGNRYANHRKLVLQPVEDFSHVQSIVTALCKIAQVSGKFSEDSTSTSTKQRKKYLIIVNPCSGRQNGVSLCDELTRPMLEQAGIDTTVIVTKYPRHATEICSFRSSDNGTFSIDDSGDIDKSSNSNDLDIASFDALVVLGGDGTIYEVLNGIQQRSDKDSVFKNLPIGVVGCGTGNGFATSLAYASQERHGAITDTFLIAKGRTETIDISKYEVFAQDNDNHNANSTGVTRSIVQYISFLTFSWAFISDVDLESECIRWVGELRFDLWAVWRILFLRKYSAKFSYRPATGGTLASQNTNQTATMPALTDPIPSDWKIIDEPIILFWASHVTHVSTFSLVGGKIYSIVALNFSCVSSNSFSSAYCTSGLHKGF